MLPVARQSMRGQPGWTMNQARLIVGTLDAAGVSEVSAVASPDETGRHLILINQLTPLLTCLPENSATRSY